MRHPFTFPPSKRFSLFFFQVIWYFYMKVKTLRRASEPLQPHLLITPICSCHLHDRFYSFSLLPSCVSLFPLPDTVRSLTECKDWACAEHFDVERDERTQAPLYQSRPPSMTCEQLSHIAKISPTVVASIAAFLKKSFVCQPLWRAMRAILDYKCCKSAKWC